VDLPQHHGGPQSNRVVVQIPAGTSNYTTTFAIIPMSLSALFLGVMPELAAAFEADQSTSIVLGVVATAAAVAGGFLVVRCQRSKQLVVVEDDEDEDKAGEEITEENSGVEVNRTKEITMEEVEKHNEEGSCWIVVEKKVYDATPYLEKHPGGSYAVMQFAGQDATEDYKEIHSKTADRILSCHQIGVLKE